MMVLHDRQVVVFFLLHDPLCVSRANGLCHWGRLCTATPVTAGGDYPVGVHATGRQPGSRRTAGAPHRRRARPRPGVRGESRPGRAAPRRIGGRPNGARRPELPPSGGVLAQCGRGRAPRLGGSRRLPRPPQWWFTVIQCNLYYSTGLKHSIA